MKTIHFIVLFVICMTNSIAQTNYENLVFEGAGIRGLAYSGVIKQLEDHHIMPQIKKVGGTSAGAITAMMIALGYNSKEIYEIISTTKFQKFNDGQFIFIGGFSRMNSKYGWYKGGAFIKWLEHHIEAKTGNKDITFAELKQHGFKELYVTGTCLNKQKLLIFSAQTYPHMKIKDAVRISMSVPVYFEAVFIDQEGKVYKKPHAKENLDVVVDGGVIGNFPIFMFDSISTTSGKTIRIPNQKTIGVRIDSELQIQNDSITQELIEMPIHNMTDYLNSFYTLILENLNRNTLTSEDWKRTISVSSVGISPRIKKLSPAQKQAFMDSGEKYTQLFLQKDKYSQAIPDKNIQIFMQQESQNEECIPAVDTLDKQNVFLIVDKYAEFQGGTHAFDEYVMKHLQFPKEQMEWQGSIYVTFIIDTSGTIKNEQVCNRSFEGRLSPVEIEALRLIKEMPNWTPAIKNSQTVYSRKILPIRFIR